MSPRCFLLVVLMASLTATMARRAAAASGDVPLVHPIYAKLPDLAEDDFTRRAFTAATARYKLAPLEIIQVPAAPAPTRPAIVKSGVANRPKLAFNEAPPGVDPAPPEIDTTE